jgi:glycosyltransferase involved in cell wall biosynthesis
MKRIMFIESGTTGYGGSYQSLYQTINILNPKKFQAIVVFFNETFIYEKLIKKGVECYYVKDVLYSGGNTLKKKLFWKLDSAVLKIIPFFSVMAEYFIHFFTIQKLTSLARGKRVDLIHLNTQLSRDFFGLFVAKSLSVPCVIHLRSFKSAKMNRYKADYVNKINTRYIAISNQIKKHWTDKGLSSQYFETIYNIFQPYQLDEISSNEIPLMTDYDGYKIIYVGRFADFKGIPFLIDTFYQLIIDNYDARLYLVGDGDEESKIRKKVSALNLEKHVIFFGYQKNTLSYIKNADLLVLPSNNEPFGRVLLEAMYIGTPAIGTKTGGIPEIIEDGVSGLLVDYGDVEALKKSIIIILKNEQVRKKLIRGGGETINSRFRDETYQRKLENIYTTLLDVAN